MSSLKDLLAKAEKTLERVSQQATQTQASSSTKTKRACPECGGEGQYIRSIGYLNDNEEWIETFHITLFCTQCEAGRRGLEKRIASLFKASGLPGDIQLYSLESFNPDSKVAYPNAEHTDVAYKAALRLMSHRELRSSGKVYQGVYVYGPNGVGKSVYLQALTAEMVRSGVPSKYISLSLFLEKVRASYGNDSADAETAADMLAYVEKAAFLAVDDLGVENDTDWVQEKLFQILDSRINRQGLMTCFSANLDPTHFAEQLSDEGQARRILSRLVGIALPVHMGGKDLRSGR